MITLNINGDKGPVNLQYYCATEGLIINTVIRNSDCPALKGRNSIKI
jgi:hypothetical protein